MKKFISIFIFLFTLSIYLGAQTADVFEEISVEKVPDKVIKSFDKIHPNQKVDRWGYYRERYEAKFFEDEHWVFSRFNKEGKYIEDRVLMNWKKEAPEKLVTGKQKTEQKYWNVTEFYKRISDSGDISYILQLESDDNQLETLYFDESGELEVKSQSGY